MIGPLWVIGISLIVTSFGSAVRSTPTARRDRPRVPLREIRTSRKMCRRPPRRHRRRAGSRRRATSACTPPLSREIAASDALARQVGTHGHVGEIERTRVLGEVRSSIAHGLVVDMRKVATIEAPRRASQIFDSRMPAITPRSDASPDQWPRPNFSVRSCAVATRNAASSGASDSSATAKERRMACEIIS